MATTPTNAHLITIATGDRRVIHTNGSDRKGVVNMVSLCNTHTADVTITLETYVDAAAEYVTLLNDRVLVPDETYTFDGVLVLDEDDSLWITTDVADDPHVFVSIVEVT